MAPRLFFYFALILTGLMYGLILYKKLSKPFKYLTQLLVIIVSFEIGSHLLVGLIGTNLPIYHFLNLLQIGYYGYIYFILLDQHRKTRITLSLLFLGSIMILIIGLLSFTSLYSFPSLGLVLISLLIICAALFKFYNMLKYPSRLHILKQSVFWFNTGNLLFFSITFFVFGYYQYFLSENIAPPAWRGVLIRGANYLLYSCYLISLVLEARYGPYHHRSKDHNEIMDKK